MAVNCVVLPCTCKSEFQDKTYGKGNRLHNIGPKTKAAEPKRRCTVCAHTK